MQPGGEIPSDFFLRHFFPSSVPSLVASMVVFYRCSYTTVLSVDEKLSNTQNLRSFFTLLTFYIV